MAGPIRPSELKNKELRSDMHRKLKKQKQKTKTERRKQLAREEKKDPSLKEKRLKENVPKTIENTREKDETMADPAEADEEVEQDKAMDELASYFNGKMPKLVITSSKRMSAEGYDFCAELLSLFPDAQFAKREKHHQLKDVIEQSIKHEFTDLMIVNEDKKQPNAITLMHLPNGPSAYFKLSNFVSAKKLPGHGAITAHNPEIILNNFNTRLGHTIGRMFQALYPHTPEFEGRQVVTFHNQRDFIFVRRHRYVFRDTEKVGLQELGPKFTLKLRWLQKGLYDRDGEYEWIFKPELETSRKRFFL